MPGWQPPRANEIDRRLRDDFRRTLKEYGIATKETDPVLAVLFRSVAVQVAEVYDQAAETIPVALLDELIAGLGMPERRARPAQTVLQCSAEDGTELFEAGTELIGEASSKEKLTFALDTKIEVSPAEISLVAIYQNNSLKLHGGTQLPKELEDARPSSEAVPAELGPSPAIFVAVDVQDERHLSNHGFYFELKPEARDLLSYLKREVWCLIDDEGGIREQGLLRPRTGNGGVRRLEWLTGDATPKASDDVNFLREGFYGGRVLVFPEVPPERRFMVKTPKKMEAPLKRIFQATNKDLFDRPRVWLRIALPQEAAGVAEDLVRIMLHCTTASNVRVLNQTVKFDQTGTAIPVGNGTGQALHLVKPISIKGEHGSEYLNEFDPTIDEQAGRYLVRRGRLEIKPACTLRSIPDQYVNVRLLLSNGASGNEVGPGAITKFLNRSNSRNLQIKNLNNATGGADGESYDEARLRFTQLLLSRERPLTHLDLEAFTRAFDPRIRSVFTSPVLEREPDGLRRVQQITVTLDRATFTLPDEEARVLQLELEAALQERSLLGLAIRVGIEWT